MVRAVQVYAIPAKGKLAVCYGVTWQSAGILSKEG
jgi:hypothetical protein